MLQRMIIIQYHFAKLESQFAPILKQKKPLHLSPERISQWQRDANRQYYQYAKSSVH